MTTTNEGKKCECGKEECPFTKEICRGFPGQNLHRVEYCHCSPKPKEEDEDLCSCDDDGEGLVEKCGNCRSSLPTSTSPMAKDGVEKLVEQFSYFLDDSLDEEQTVKEIKSFIRSHESRLAREVLGVVPEDEEKIRLPDDSPENQKIEWWNAGKNAARATILAKFDEMGITVE